MSVSIKLTVYDSSYTRTNHAYVPTVYIPNKFHYVPISLEPEKVTHKYNKRQGYWSRDHVFGV
jgi:hypothetical protein